jgi:hypothetical protein
MRRKITLGASGQISGAGHGFGLRLAGLSWRQCHSVVTTRKRLHRLVDELSDQDECALVIVERWRNDPMLHTLAAAELDDEPSDPAEAVSADEALAAYRRGEGISSAHLRAELDLD